MSTRAPVQGIVFALTAYTLWGLAPLYFKLLPSLSAVEIVVHRVIWTVVVTFFLVLITRQLGEVKRVLQSKKIIFSLTLSAILIGANWLIYIWAVINEQMLEASLGYFINPLINVLLGFAFFAERLRRMQWVAVAIATTIVLGQIIAYGEVPWIALALALSFGVYGVVRKHLSLPAVASLFLESLVLLPFALMVLTWLWQQGSLASLQGMLDHSMVIGLGIVTAAPLLFFTAAARHVRLVTLGFFQYIGPSIVFVTAIWLFDEQVTPGQWWSFGAVWLALVVYSIDSLRAQKQVLPAS